MEKTNDITQLLAQCLVLSSQPGSSSARSVVSQPVSVMGLTASQLTSSHNEVLQRTLLSLIQQSRDTPVQASLTPVHEVVEKGLVAILHNSRQLGKKERVSLASVLDLAGLQLPCGDLGIAEIVVWFMAVVFLLPKNQQEILISNLFRFYRPLQTLDPKNPNPPSLW